MFLKDIIPYLHRIIGTNAKDIAVIGSMMNLAERQAIGDNGQTQFISVRNYMGRIKQFGMLEPTDRTTAIIGMDDEFPKCILMQTSFCFHCKITSDI